MNWTNDYIGIPYLEHGRTKAGADCYGLLRLALLEVFRKSIPEYANYDNAIVKEKSLILDELMPLVNGVQVATPEPGDIVFSILRGTLWHFGLYAGNGEFLHTLAPHDSCVERVDSMKWRTRIEGFYRV